MEYCWWLSNIVGFSWKSQKFTSKVIFLLYKYLSLHEKVEHLLELMNMPFDHLSNAWSFLSEHWFSEFLRWNTSLLFRIRRLGFPRNKGYSKRLISSNWHSIQSKSSPRKPRTRSRLSLRNNPSMMAQMKSMNAKAEKHKWRRSFFPPTSLLRRANLSMHVITTPF